MSWIQKKIASWLVKSAGFPTWNAAGPWPQSVISAYGGDQSAMQLAVVYGCVRVRGQTIGSLPFHVYREDAGGLRIKAIDHWLYPILHDSPSATQTAMEWRECMERSFCLWGNAYSEIRRVGKRVAALEFLRPEWMHPRWDYIKGDLVYDYTAYGKMETLPREKILHIKNFSSNGFYGDSPIRTFAMNHAMEAQNYGRNFLQNLGRPSGFVKQKVKRPVSDETANKYRNDWQAVYGGPENAGKTAVLWDDAEYVPISIPPDEAQYIETRNFSIEEIAGGIYGVPLNLIGHTDKTATYASAEHFDIAYVKHTVRPQCIRYEQAINKALLSLEPGIYCEMDLDGLLRGDSAAQATFFATVRSNGGMTSNEWRRKMNFPESTDPGADELMQQSNMVPLRMAGQLTSTIPNNNAPVVPGGKP